MSLLELDIRFARRDFGLDIATVIAPGVTGICGPSGAGKSTLLALLAGLLHPAAGFIRFDGETLFDHARRIAVPAWQRHFGWVFQDGMLFPHLNVRANLLYGHARLPAHQRRITLDAVLALLELGDLLERRPANLSGGQRQRVALGRALLYSPRLLLLDEPLSALDERLKQQILHYLKRIRDELQIPMIYVSHARDEVDFLSDRVLWIEGGRLVARTGGPLASLPGQAGRPEHAA